MSPSQHNLCSLILSYIPSSRRSDLLALLKSSKAFHEATEPIFYSYVIFTNLHRARAFAHTIAAIPRLADHVKTFGVNLQEYRSTTADRLATDPSHLQLAMCRDVWEDIRHALQCMSSLQVLVLAQMQTVEMDLTWVLDAPFSFSLREVKLHIPFDHHVATFLRHQSSLSVVQMYAYEPPVDATTPTEPTASIALPHLTRFDGSLSVASYILIPSSPPPLTHLQLLIDTIPTPTSPPSASLFSSLPLLSSTLRGLSLLDLPKQISTPLLVFLSQTHPLADSLTHISHISLPFPSPSHSPERVEFLGALIRLRRLRTIEATLNAWDLGSNPTLSHSVRQQHQGPGVAGVTHNSNNNSQDLSIPTTAAQKALVAEMKTYCPTLQTVVFWVGKTRFRWTFIIGGIPIHNPASGSGSGSGSGSNNGGGSGSGGDRNAGDRNGLAFQRDNINISTMATLSRSSTRLENAAVGGEWQHRVDTNQWPALSNLWCTC